MVSLNINGRGYDVDVEPETPLLWVLRDTLGLTGTKFGCGAAICGACTVHVDGSPMRSCALRIGMLGDREITTIEAIARAEGSSGHLGLDRGTGAAMRLLPGRPDHDGDRAAREQSPSPATPTSTAR